VEFVIVLVVLALVVLVVSAPLRRGRPTGSEPLPADRAELETAREAKYREIREAELDHRMGKLSDADFEAVEAQLRTEAVEILRALDEFSDPRRSNRETKGAGDGKARGD
jgi:hypothetical protein